MSISVIIPVGHKDDNFSLIDQIKSKFKDFEIIIAASYQNSIVKEQKIMSINSYQFIIQQEQKL